MQDKNKKTASTKRTKVRQQTSDKKTVKRVTEKATRTEVAHNANPAGKNARRENAPIAVSNPRRIKKHSKVYGYVIAIILIILGVIVFLVLFTFTSADLAKDATEMHNLFGWVGAQLADMMLSLFGLASFIFSAVCLLLGIRTICGKNLVVNHLTLVGLVMLLLGTTPLLYLAFDNPVLEHDAGGAIGKWVTNLAQPHIGIGWLITVTLALCLFGILFVTDTSIKAFFLGLWQYLVKGVKAGVKKIGESLKKDKKEAVISAQNHDDDSDETSDSAPEQAAVKADNDGDSIYEEETNSALLNEKPSEADDPEPSPAEEAASEEASHEELANTEMASDDLNAVAAEERDENGLADLFDDDEEDLADISDQELNEFNEVLREEIRQQSEHEIQKEEKKEKPERSEGLNDLMARILRNNNKTPKSRPVRRHHSVPAIEPQYDFDSILSPEQISKKGETDVPTGRTTGGVLGDWKPRSIGRKPNTNASNNGVQASDAKSDNQDGPQPTIALPEEDVPAPAVPQNITADVLAQLESEEMHDSSDISDIAFAETRQLNRPQKDNIHEAATRIGNRQDADDADIMNKISAMIHGNSSNKPSQPEKTAIPVSSELRALMAEARPEYKPKLDLGDMSDETPDKSEKKRPVIKNDEQFLSKDDKESSDGKRTIQPESPVQPHPNAFVVAKEKKRASADELDQADKARLKNLSTSVAYQRPPLSLLHYDPSTQKRYDNDALKIYADKIEEKLLEYHIEGQVVQICPGPIITRFEFQPAPGTKVSRISGLSDDLMMALEITSIRILAPIPGKNVVGIEIPNEKRDTIYLKEVLGSKEFTESKSILTIALGKDSEGTPVVSDLAKMPHLLVAGSTGSGKSVAINTMICSLLYNATPDEVKLILVDPKCLELSIYEGIPHLLVPPITTPQETAAALDWACNEMDERYRLLSSFGVRNIAGYNEQLKHPTLPRAIEHVAEKDENGDCIYKPMPYIVIIVDEFADLMMTSGKEIETSIARLAQKARAAGIHIILATQRPSTNVITGVIKANFPTRLAFRVFSYVDSRTILDTKGAESLLGMGDSLFLPPNSAILQRVHGAFVSDDEVQSIVDFLAQQRAPEYNLDITAPKEDADSGDGDGSSASQNGEYDNRYDEAVRLVAEAGQASASFLQRRMGIGFQRASRIIDQMEKDGVVGPQKGQKPREVLIKPI